MYRDRAKAWVIRNRDVRLGKVRLHWSSLNSNSLPLKMGLSRPPFGFIFSIFF